jgi:hypothetical protein
MTPLTGWPRVRELGDAIRKLLATANLVGIGMLLALAASLAGSAVPPRWTVPAVGVFTAGVICVVIGYVFAEHRAIKQADANRPLTFPFWKWGITWNLASLALLLAGAVIGIRSLNAVEVKKPAPALNTAPPGASQPRYAAIFDAGSSGSRLWIFQWSKDPHDDPIVERLETLEDRNAASKDCRLTYMVDKEEETCNCLLDLAMQGQQHIAKAAGSPPTAVPLWVKATGGVRKQLPLTQIDILAKTNSCLQRAKNYSWRGAEAIAGSTEALYAWLAVNYARKTLQSGTGTFGIAEIGGESAQVAFEVDMAIAPTQRGFVAAVPLSSGTRHVYTHSDVLGKEAVIGALGKDRASKCGLKSNAATCRSAINRFLCPPDGKPCMQRSPEFAPGDIKFIGLSNFKHIVSNSGFDQGSLLDVKNRADLVCGPGAPKDAMRKQFFRARPDFAEDVCLDAVYTTRVAEFAWKLPLTAVTPAEKDVDPDWPLGAMFLEIAQRSDRNAL